jgi:hypothetical protein
MDIGEGRISSDIAPAGLGFMIIMRCKQGFGPIKRRNPVDTMANKLYAKNNSSVRFTVAPGYDELQSLRTLAEAARTAPPAIV